MNVLITGASGFIGSCLIRHFLDATSYNVTGVSRKNPGIESPSYKHISLDMAEEGWTSSLDSDIDVVIHLAQSEHYRQFPDYASDMLAVNINATCELLEWSRLTSVRQFIFSSTGNVYTQHNEILYEEDECVPVSMYAATKMSAELLAKQYASFFQVTVMRLFGVYGPGQKKMLIPTMIERVVSGDEIHLASGVGIIMNPVFISDCISYICRIMGNNSLESYIVLNVAGPEVLSLKDIVLSIGRVLSITPVITRNDASPGYLAGSIDRIKKRTGYKPEVTFDVGIERTVTANFIGD